MIKEYFKKRRQIEKRMMQFCSMKKASPRKLFEELAFCILTPQSKAVLCHEAILELKKSGLLFEGDEKEIAAVLKGKARFHNNKARFLVAAREFFGRDGFKSLKELTFMENNKKARELLVKNVKGIGLKEATHYLRNVGRGEGLAILDRHVLKNLALHKVIKKPPKSLTKSQYSKIEEKMVAFCKKMKVPIEHADLLFWARETGFFFK
ncbi:MAG: N-glycosylase/DNA lyase [Candidatus Anstonellaceae archaeon]